MYPTGVHTICARKTCVSRQANGGGKHAAVVLEVFLGAMYFAHLLREAQKSPKRCRCCCTSYRYYSVCSDNTTLAPATKHSFRFLPAAVRYEGVTNRRLSQTRNADSAPVSLSRTETKYAARPGTRISQHTHPSRTLPSKQLLPNQQGVNKQLAFAKRTEPMQGGREASDTPHLGILRIAIHDHQPPVCRWRVRHHDRGGSRQLSVQHLKVKIGLPV